MPLLRERLRERLLAPPALPLYSGDNSVGRVPFESEIEQPPIPAAVLIPIISRPEPALLLTTRTATLRSHAGQVAFPGGRIDATDADAVAAALREANEEIGLRAEDVDIVGPADPYCTATGYHISPIVGLIRPGALLTPSPDEVADIFEVPLDYALDPVNHVLREILWQGKMRHYYEIKFQERQIWGATAAMLVNLASRLR